MTIQQILLGAGVGAAGPFNGTISTNQTNLNLSTYALANGWNGTSAVTITINAGVWIYSTSTGTPALTTGSFPGGLTIVNNGFIAGMGGNGGSQFPTFSLSTAGGIAISLGTNVTIDNTNASAYIGGGGGGGASQTAAGVGGGAGGGAGGGTGGGGGGNASTGVGGAGGAINTAGSNGGGVALPPGSGGGAGGGGGSQAVQPSPTRIFASGGGGGGRIFPGTGGAGGPTGSGLGGAGGAGSAVGANAGGTASGGGGGGGGWGAKGGNNRAGTAIGASGGRAVALNGFTVTWTAGNTTRVYGTVS